MKTLLVIQILVAMVIIVWIRPSYEKSQRDRRIRNVRLNELIFEIQQRCRSSKFDKNRWSPSFLSDATLRPNKFDFSWRLELIAESHRHDDDYREPIRKLLVAQSLDEIKSIMANVPNDYSFSRCPSSIGTDKTAIVAVVDVGTVVQTNRIVAPEAIVDGAENTGMLIELQDSDIAWWEARDLTIEEAITAIRNCGDSEGLNVSLASGKVVAVPPDTPAEEIKKLFTVNDGVPSIQFKRRRQ
ncbi:MAG: hypothetical protein JNL67_01990 [Planctomycetaceae bacterium]|nr:hypothetical protein [Planctomycetaceae bacterium]